MYPINFTVTMDYEIYEKFFIFSLFKNSKYKKSKFFHLLPFVLSLPLSIFLLIFVDLPFLLIPIFTLTVFGLAFFVLVLYIMPKTNFKKMPRTFLVPQNYSFNETYFEDKVESDATSGYTKMNYSELFKIYETHDALYLFISSIQSFVIPKKILTDEQIILIREAILKNIELKKYKKCYKD